MVNNILSKLKNRKGFTLVELLIVIAVLGIIAAIAVPRFTGVLSGVKNKADVRAAELWAKEIEAEFMVKNWSFDSGAITISSSTTTPGTSTYAGFTGSVPKSSNGTDYLIAVITNTPATTSAIRSVSCVIYRGSVAGTNILITKDLTLPID